MNLLKDNPEDSLGTVAMKAIVVGLLEWAGAVTILLVIGTIAYHLQERKKKKAQK